jgi:hypothetical protein
LAIPEIYCVSMTSLLLAMYTYCDKCSRIG